MAEPTIKFKGDAASGFHSSIPARDLSAEEYDALSKEERATVRESPLYDYEGYRARVDPPKQPADPPKGDSGKDDDKSKDPPKKS